jgi:hypothetical protein
MMIKKEAAAHPWREGSSMGAHKSKERVFDNQQQAEGDAAERV